PALPWRASPPRLTPPPALPWRLTSSPSLARPARPERQTRRAMLAGLATLTAAACAAPWARPADRLPLVPLPSPAPGRGAPPVLHVVLAQEGLPPLDATVRQATTEAAR